MQHLNIECPPRNRVTAVFEANALSFELPLAATLEDLAARLADLGDRHDGTLISVDVRVQS
jgi:hypothetical protein